MKAIARVFFLVFCLLLSFSTYAQNTADWNKADSLIDRGMPESARKLVEKLYDDAQVRSQKVQMLKAQLYLMRINTGNKEDADSLNIAFGESQIYETEFPISAVWRSITAQLYWHYYQTNRYKILSRTPVGTRLAAARSDFAQWDAQQFFDRSTELYITSLGEIRKLKRIPIDSLNPVLIKGVNTQNLRPTLFDLLAFRAIDFFENDEKDLTKPAYQFVMDDAAAFAPASDFIRHAFPSQDTFSTQRLALTLYQQVLAMHMGDKNQDAFIDADLQRLEFAFTHSVHPDKTEMYRMALSRIEHDYAGNPLSALASYRLAQLIVNGRNLEAYEPDDEENPGTVRPDLRAAKQKLDSIIAKYPKSEGGISAQQLLQTITAPSLSLTAEEAMLPDEPSRILVGYRNVPKAFVRIVKVNADDVVKKGTDYYDTSFVNPLLRKQPAQAFTVNLPGTEDYSLHHTEVKVNALPVGMYAIFISAKESFDRKDNAISYAIGQSTNLAIVTQANGKPDQPAGYVLHRKTGEPVADANVFFLKSEWNRRGTRYDVSRSGAIRTDAQGAFRVSGNDLSYAGCLVKKGEDAFYSNNYLNFYRYKESQRETDRAFLFTDRSIYRPGQTIFFKGIFMRRSADGRESNVLSGEKEELTFYDVNGQVVTKQTLTTNEWGSVAGSFTAPQTGLTGQMRIQSENGVVYFSVEEYKRPKFRVDWDTLKTDYALNEEVSITGYAQAYAGNNVDGASVKFRVVRNVRWPFWWYSWRYTSPSEGGGRGEAQMAEGTTTTDASGKFTVRFTAMPDRSVDERSLPVFTYTVYADVSDLNGETRSGQKSISAGYRSLQIVAGIPEQASRKDLDTVHITTQNLNGDFVPASVNIKVARLAQPDVIYRKRYWPVPDQFAMSEAEFRKAFPLDAYKDEDDYRKWKEAETTLARTLTTTRAGLIAFPASAFPRNSWYCITISAKDKNGKPVEEKKFVQVWDKGAEGKIWSILEVRPPSQVRQPGEVAQVPALTGATLAHIIEAVSLMTGEVSTTQHDISGDPVPTAALLDREWVHLVTEADRGGIALSYLTVKDNRIYTASAHVDVPWTNKDLSIEWETHRDKLQPGQKETWTMIIRGNKKEKVAAEMAAALYDASLDAFKPHGWGIGSLFPLLNPNMNWNSGVGFGPKRGNTISGFNVTSPSVYEKEYDQLLIDEDYELGRQLSFASPRSLNIAALNVRGGRAAKAKSVIDGVQLPAGATAFTNQAPMSVETKTGDANGIEPGLVDNPENANKASDDIPLRKNLQETAFFYPQLHTDAEGAVRIEFAIPEALTEWKLLAFAHTKDMRTGYTTGTVKTQKNLMVQPSLPRFLRQGDDFSLSAKIVNLTDSVLSGTATLEILDAVTGRPLAVPFVIRHDGQLEAFTAFHAPARGSTSATWTFHVAESQYEPVIIRIYAKSGSFTDGEENTLPVITNRMLITETVPLWMNGTGTKTFSIDRLLHVPRPRIEYAHTTGIPHQNFGDPVYISETTLVHHSLTLEYTSNPTWLAVKALPYLMEYPYECAEQTFNRYYANALAAHVLDKAPKVKAIFKKWREEALLSSFVSPLQINQELKSALLEETPWVLAAESESEQRKNIAMLFETDKLARDLDKAARKLADMQLPEGGWAWFKGADRPDRYITQYILTGIGRLRHLGVADVGTRRGAFGEETLEKAIAYLDRQMQKQYDELLREKADLQQRQHIGYFDIQYAYMRSFFPDIKSGLSEGAQNFYKLQANKYWPQFNPYLKGMMAIAAARDGQKQIAADIIQSLKETAIQKEELGMYWMEPGRSWWWYDAPIEAQSLLIECFGEVAKDDESVDKMKRWLLKQKQTQNWSTTKATADACYALLLQGSQWLTSEPEVSIQLGDTTIRSADQKQEAGSGYFKVRIPGAEVKPEMGNITLKVESDASAPLSAREPSWGAVYWQYFENLDKISAAATPLQVKKQFFIEKNSDRGPVLEAIADGASLKVGDKVKARIEIIVDRDMEYVHLKDGRASCFEPVNVLSGYRWQGGLGYYESTRDASSNFFFSYLPKGKYVFEYPMFVTNAGDFSAGLATIQCMYAPEFAAHSEGLRVSVK